MDPITFDVVRPYDPEVIEHCEPVTIARYAIDRDIETLGLPPSARPVIFRCRVLTRDQRRRVRELSSDHLQRELAFRYGVSEIRNLPRAGQMADHVLVNRKAPDAAIDDATLDGLGVGDTDVEDIGAAILGRSFLALGLRPECAVPASSQRACETAFFRHAERKSASDSDKSSADPEAQPDLMP